MFKSLHSSYPDAPECPDDLVTGPPSFVGVGTMRSGTSWWYELIARHPRVFTASFLRAHKIPVKERHFFDRFCQTPFGARDAEQYARWFPRPRGMLAGEFTPSYMLDHWVPPLLARAAPDARLIVLLRDPVERYVSGLRLQLQQGEPRTTTELAREQTLRGFYLSQLHGLLRSFDRAQLLVLQYERCRADPAAQLARTYRFLEIDDSFVPADLHEPINVSRADRYALDPEQRASLSELYAEPTRQLAAEFPDIDLALWPSAK
jgi:hypothetical protein